MKKTLCCLIISTSVLTAHQDVHLYSSRPKNYAHYVQPLCMYGSIASGWAFFATSQIPAVIQRAPVHARPFFLAAFLTANTVNQLFTYYCK